jgi:rare lipoprotein A (peptidoglycan hydrolase)
MGAPRRWRAGLLLWLCLAGAVRADEKEVILVREGTRTSRYVYEDGQLVAEASWSLDGKFLPDKPNPLAGMASHYGGSDGFAFSATASGAILNDAGFTAAHRTLPLGSLVRVTNLKNGRVTTVRINDRGPFFRERIIDVTQAAAAELGMTEQGVVPVRLQVVATAPPHIRSGAGTPSSQSPVDKTVATPAVKHKRASRTGDSALRTGQSWQKR